MMAMESLQHKIMKNIIYLIILLLPSCVFAQGTKVKDLPETTNGSTGDFLIKDNVAGTPGSTKKISVANFISTYSLSTAQTTSVSSGLNVSVSGTVPSFTVATTTTPTFSTVTSGTGTFTTINVSTENVSTALNVNGNITFSPTVNSSLSGSNARIPSHTTANLVFTNASLTSIASANNGGVSGGHLLYITNETGSTITIIDNYGSAAAGEAIITGKGANVTLPTHSSFALQYNATGSYWTFLGGGNAVSMSTNTLTVGVLTATTIATNSLSVNGYNVSVPATATISGSNTGDVIITAGNGNVSVSSSGQSFTLTPATSPTFTTVTTNSLVVTNATLPVIQTISTSTITPDNTKNTGSYASSSTAFSIVNPSTTFADGQGYLLIISDNSVARSIAFGNLYVAMAQALPTTTTAGKRMAIYFVYNSTYGKYLTWYSNEQ